MNSAETPNTLANIKERLDKVEILVMSDNPFHDMIVSMREDIRFLVNHLENLPPNPVDQAKDALIEELQEQINTYSSVSGQLLILLSTTLDTSSKFASTLRATDADLTRLLGASFSLQSMMAGQPVSEDPLAEPMSAESLAQLMLGEDPVDQPLPEPELDPTPTNVA